MFHYFTAQLVRCLLRLLLGTYICHPWLYTLKWSLPFLQLSVSIVENCTQTGTDSFRFDNVLELFSYLSGLVTALIDVSYSSLTDVASSGVGAMILQYSLKLRNLLVSFHCPNVTLGWQIHSLPLCWKLKELLQQHLLCSIFTGSFSSWFTGVFDGVPRIGLNA